MTHRTPGGPRPASRTFNRFLRHTLGAWLARRFQVRYDATVLRTLTAPYLLVGNHTCNWDPFLLSVPVHNPVHFVASDEYFRTPLLRFAFSLVGGIPKTKNVHDTQAVRTLLALRRAGAILGLYPEGNRSWDGVTGPIYAATAKLIRKLAIPVVSVETTGGSLVQPRWARHARHGPMLLSYRLLFTAEECRTLSEQSLSERLAAALAHDDLEALAAAGDGVEDGRNSDADDGSMDRTMKGRRYAGRRLADMKGRRYIGRRLAERLERFLFQCPACGRQDTLSSRDDRLRCTTCGLTVRYGTDGLFHAVRSGEGRGADGGHADCGRDPGTGHAKGIGDIPPPFGSPRDWNRWQCALLADSIRTARQVSGTHTEEAPVLLRNDGARHRTGGRTGPLRPAGTGSLSLLADRLVFQDGDAGRPPLVLPLAGTSGLNIQYNDRVELYHGDTLHRFSFPDTGISVWKWHQALLYAGVPGPEADIVPAAPAGTAPAGTAPDRTRTMSKQDDPGTASAPTGGTRP